MGFIKLKYMGPLFILDDDCISPGNQIEFFGQVCHGWGEIFIVENGGLTKQYPGKNSFIDFAANFDNEKIN